MIDRNRQTTNDSGNLYSKVMDSLQRRAVRIVDNPKLTDGLVKLQQWKDFVILCVFYLYFYEESLRNCLVWYRLRNVLSYYGTLWNKLPETVFLESYYMSFFKLGDYCCHGRQQVSYDSAGRHMQRLLLTIRWTDS